MSLPFMKPKPLGAVMIHRMEEDGKQEVLHEEGQPDPGLVLAVEDFYKASQSRDISAMVRALQSAFQIMDAEPDIEGDHG